MNVKINDMKTSETLLDVEYIRMSIHEKRLSLMLAGGFNQIANSMQNKKLIQLIIETDVGNLEIIGTTVSYNFILASTPSSQEKMVVCDNTILIEIVD